MLRATTLTGVRLPPREQDLDVSKDGTSIYLSDSTIVRPILESDNTWSTMKAAKLDILAAQRSGRFVAHRCRDSQPSFGSLSRWACARACVYDAVLQVARVRRRETNHDLAARGLGVRQRRGAVGERGLCAGVREHQVPRHAAVARRPHAAGRDLHRRTARLPGRRHASSRRRVPCIQPIAQPTAA